MLRSLLNVELMPVSYCTIGLDIPLARRSPRSACHSACGAAELYKLELLIAYSICILREWLGLTVDVDMSIEIKRIDLSILWRLLDGSDESF